MFRGQKRLKSGLKTRTPASTHKKVVVELMDQEESARIF